MAASFFGLCMASNYAHLIEQIVAHNQASRAHYAERHPRGQQLLAELEKPDSWNHHPVLGEGDGDEYSRLSDSDWAAFLDELTTAHEMATRQAEADDEDGNRVFMKSLLAGRQMDLDEEEAEAEDPGLMKLLVGPRTESTDWRRELAQDASSEEEADAATLTDENIDQTVRRAEVPFQNPLWGEHRVSGGSSELGQWIDFALLGAGAQDEDEEGIIGLKASDLFLHLESHIF
ncbi:unnamed protein product [Protopolystoma xenopodis]|uniref:Uncharacterized protein n=1 Tax=Protopolystoma xenopodis TaxID=117903 RepID=A0A3S5C4P4_9PLAT|nr:unnamed protein product [Protopolystoma xenopodis]